MPQQPIPEKKAMRHPPAAERQAVIDIGSNSVRLVIYDGPKRAPTQIVNEKALCGLGRDITADGKLDVAAVKYAIETLGRFRRLLEEHRDPPTRVVATSAVREASDGSAFVKAVEKLGFEVTVVDGGEEARLAALGVVSYEPGATGLVGDMGGGSLELVGLKNGRIEENVSLAIGPLRLMQQSGGKASGAAEFIEKALDELPWLRPGRFHALYSVGGAWRAMARIHMGLRQYPLPILHHYEFSRADAMSVCDLVAKQTSRSLQEIPGLPRRRIDTLPFAAMVFRSVIERANIDKVVISAGGIREGILYRELTPEEQAVDPLFACARFFADKFSPEREFGDTVAVLTETLFGSERSQDRRVRVATCMLSDIGSFFHPDMRALQAFDSALRIPFYGATHTERIAIALSLYWRHAGRRPTFVDDHLLGLLSWEEQQRASRLGLAMRFAAALAPKAPGALAGCSLSFDGGKVEFRAPKALRSLMGELPRKRLESLAEAFEAQPAEVYY